MEQPDFYAVLGVAEDANPGQLKRAYRRLARRWHPDANPGNGPDDADNLAASQRFLAVAAAYAALRDPVRRAAYDGRRRLARVARSGSKDQPPSGHADAAIVSAPETAAAPRRGDDTTAALDIPDTLAQTGGRLVLDLGLESVCPQCRGTGRLSRVCWMCDGRGSIWQPSGPGRTAVSCPACNGQGLARAVCPACQGRGSSLQPRRGSLIIAPGTGDGAKIRVAGGGQPGSGGQPDGDLILTVRLFPAPGPGRP
jgi:molecular chaperone DnaJ